MAWRARFGDGSRLPLFSTFGDLVTGVAYHSSPPLEILDIAMYF